MQRESFASSTGGYGAANNGETVDVHSSISGDAIGASPYVPLKMSPVAVPQLPASPAAFHRYVALGDSFTEGVGDHIPTSPNGLRGWADHVAVALAQTNPDLRYANLAVRGRRMDEILDEQLHDRRHARARSRHHLRGHEQPASAAQRRRRHDGQIRRRAQDAAADRRRRCSPSPRPISAPCRCSGGCAAARRSTTNCCAGSPTTSALQLVDFWRFSEFRDSRLWDGDRIHLSPLGHERFAAKVLDTLAVSHELTSRSAALLASVATGAGLPVQPAMDRGVRGTVGGQANAAGQHRARASSRSLTALTKVL